MLYLKEKSALALTVDEKTCIDIASSCTCGFVYTVKQTMTTVEGTTTKMTQAMRMEMTTRTPRQIGEAAPRSPLRGRPTPGLKCPATT